MKQALKTAFAGFLRTLAVAVLTSIIILLILVFAFSGQSKQQQAALDEIRAGTLATVCVLALPVDPNVGRDPVAVTQCETKYGLTP